MRGGYYGSGFYVGIFCFNHGGSDGEGYISFRVVVPVL